MSKHWTRIAATLLLMGIALPAGATEYGAWQSIDTKTVKEFTPDAKIPTDLYGKWQLADVQYSKSFLPDPDLPAASRYGSWQLVDASLDRRWLADQGIRKDELGSTEIGRNLVSDEVERGQVLKDPGSKLYGEPIEKLSNPMQQEVSLGQYKRRESGRPVSTLVEQYRIDTTYDKEVRHPWTQTSTYAETEKHTRSYDVTVDHKWKMVFKDPILGKESSEYSISTEKHQEVSATGFQRNGVLSYVKRTGTEFDPLVKVTQKGAVKEREVGKTAEIASSAASSAGASAFAIPSGNQVYGSSPARISYSGLMERKQLAIDSIRLSQASAKDGKVTVDKAYLTLGPRKYKVTFHLNTETLLGVLGGEAQMGGDRTKFPNTTLKLDSLPKPGKSKVLYTGETIIVYLVNQNGKYRIKVEAK